MSLTFALVFVLLLYLVGSKLIAAFTAAIHLRLRIPESRVVNDNDVPADMQHCLTHSVPMLDKQGFQFSHFEQRQDLETAITETRWIAVYLQPVEKIFAEVTTALKPSSVSPVAITFVSLLPDIRIMTIDAGLLPIGTETEATLCYRSVAPGYQAQLATHKKHLEHYQSTRHDGSAEPCAVTSANYADRFGRDLVVYFDTLVGKGVLYRDTAGYAIGSLNVVRMVTRKNPLARIVKLSREEASPNTEVQTNILSLEVDAYNRRRQLELNNHVPVSFKAWLFLLSMVFCSTFLGLVFDWHFMLTLIPVLIIHELGHLVAMMWFGYTNKYMLFMPLGAMVVGESRDSPCWQQIIVFLAGPVPGILLGLSLLYALPEIGDNMQLFIIMLFVVNFLNLLPVAPLDGGQIVKLYLSHSRPVAQFVFHLLSLIVCAVAAVALSDPFIGIIGIVLLMSLPASYKQISLNQAYLDMVREQTDSSISTLRLFDIFRERHAGFDEKTECVKFFRSVSNQRSAPRFLASALVALYIAVVSAPVVLSIGAPSAFTTALNGSEEAEQFDYIAYMDGQLEQAESVEEKADALISYADFHSEQGDLKAGENYLLEAIELASSDPDLQRVHANSLAELAHCYRRQAKPTQLESTLDLLEENARESVEFRVALAEFYTVAAMADEYAGDEKQQMLLRSVDLYEESGADTELLFAREQLAQLHFDNGQRREARRIRLESTQLAFGDDADWLRSMAYRHLAYSEIIESRLTDAQTSLTSALQFSDSEVPDPAEAAELMWVGIFLGQTEEIETFVDKSRRDRKALHKAMMAELDFVTRLLVAAGGYELEDISLLEFELQVVSAYLNYEDEKLSDLLDQDTVYDALTRDEMIAVYSSALEYAGHRNSIASRKARMLLDAFSHQAIVARR